ncbi:regulator of g-protein signaling [Colletotrichum musicola]|uniref:Regulator of g-protein signaling n=1 Tax=Colletotrichum musicola TaxID=2175873 RepID=A0A8H6IVA7_9PEZI|nr:regulator of g-protein signaling [Colletotrichum musicola]
MPRSRPSSGALVPGAVILTPPSLSEILTNTSSPPWTLTAFMAYLSQNHCLETLEFTMDAERYRKVYEQIITNHEWIGDGSDHVCSLWEKLMQAYIIPYSPREVNLPSPVRDRLIAQSCASTPPPPSELDEAVNIVYELMNDSVLLPFIDGTTSRSASASGERVEREGLTDDSGSAVSPGTEPMTPPTTPPTSDWTFSTSPGGLQRALTAHNNGWKKGLEVMPSATSTTPATSTSHLPSDGLSRVRHLFNSWEEPHPGKRLPVTEGDHESEKVAGNGPQNLHGGCKGGMAAKELNPYHHTRPWLVRRPIRVRTRTNTPVPLKITTEISEEHDVKSAPLPIIRNVGTLSPATDPASATEAVATADADKPAPRPAGGFCATEVKPNELPLPASPPLNCQFTDFSNLLGISVQSPPGETVAVASPEPVAYFHATPEEDIYGWDAELVRQSKQSSPTLPYSCDQEYQYRRTSMTKRSLLHRVFSMTPVSKDTNFEARRASSSSAE